MSYRAGIGPGMVRLGYTPQEPHVVCDECGKRRTIQTRKSWAAQWFLDGKPPPGWKGTRKDGQRADYCSPECWRAKGIE